MAWTKQSETTANWKDDQQQERGDIAFDSNIAFDYSVPFDGWGDPDIYWSQQTNPTSTWIKQ